MKEKKQILLGRVLSPDCGGAEQGYVLIEGNRILKTGRGKPELPRGEAVVRNFGDGLILPGFHDAHTHILQGTLTAEGADLRDAVSEEAAARILYETSKAKKCDSFWVLGGAWDHFRWQERKLPGKESLDRYFPDRPVFLLNKECHGAWVNSKALEYFHITRETEDPAKGKIYRDARGNPSGYLHEAAALKFISVIYDVSDFEHLELVRKFSRRTARWGVTSVSDMQIYDILKYQGCAELERRGELKVRVHFCPPMTEGLETLTFLKKRFCSERLRFSGAKGFVDGTPMGHTGLLLEEYGDRPGFFGSAVLAEDDLLRRVAELDGAGIRLRLHACGDGAVRLALLAYGCARRKNGDSGLRHTVEHIECMHLEDAPLFGELGVIASVQPDHLPKYDFFRHPFHEILGPERLRTAWPFQSIEAAGATLAFGTDYPIAPLDPLRGVFRAVTRLTDDGQPQGGFNPQQKLSVQSALRAYTLGGAYCNYRENDLGSLEPGKLADIVVLDRDLLKCEPAAIREARVRMTMLDGEVIYEEGDECE